MIDGGINTSHPALVNSALRISGCAGETRPTGHGTAVASLIVTAASLSVPQPRIELHAADVYCGQPVGGAVDALAVALATLVRNQVAIINISLVGPRNQAMERLIHAVRQRGILVVAAVGNDGPAAKPLYPAAFPDVIAVTAVDAKQRVLAEACRGAHVQFAAPGAQIWAADAQHGYVAVRGTSFAAPIVTGLLGALIVAHAGDADVARAVLVAQAIDAGRRGRDPVYGHGVVGMPVMTAAQHH
jgi:subtilisin family serine protease